MKNMNEIIKYDKEGNITKEWLEYVENLDREDLERFFIGAYTLNDKRKERISKAIEYIDNLSNEPNVFGHYGIDGNCKKHLLEILKGEDNEI